MPITTQIYSDQHQIESQYIKIVYYNDDHSNTSIREEIMREKFNVKYSTPSTWHELINELENGCRFLIFHIDTIFKWSHHNPAEIINTVKSISKFIPQCENLTIGAIITPTTPRYIIRTLQNSGVNGILLDLNHYSIEETLPGSNAFINHIPYWPKQIIDSLPDDSLSNDECINRPLSIYFRQNYTPHLSSIERNKFESELGMEVKYCSTWTELSAAMTHHPHQIIFHYDTIGAMNASIPEVVTMLETELKIRGLSARIGVGIDRTTTLEKIKELKRSGIHGIVPSVSNWGIHECVQAIHALRDNESYWPKHIISTLPSSAKKKITEDGIKLTNRQEQVFRYIIERGASNKVIAKSLGISESAVKLHVTEILRKHGVKNRTQLAVFSKMPA